MQPYFFPYIGYFQLINYVDKWVVFDDVQYIYHGWINRNRILKPIEGWQYINIPVQKHSRDTLIKDIYIDNNQKWREKILGQLSCYKKIAPFYNEAIKIINEAIQGDYKNIVDVNIYILEVICRYLHITFEYVVSSKEDFDYSIVKTSGDWALEISRQLNVKEYVNPIGGENLFNASKFEESGIKLKFLQPKEIRYNQRRSKFESNLSIIDLIMFNSPKDIKKILNEYEVVSR